MDRYLAFEGFIYDTARRTLFRGGAPVALTPRALEILRMLLDRAGDVVTKEQLLEGLWPGEYVQESTLSQHVYLLRKAFGNSGAEDLIQTVPRRGYRFVGEIRRHAAPPAGTVRRPKTGAVRFSSLRGAARAFGAFLVLVAVLAIGFGERHDAPQRARAALDPRAERAYRLGRYYWNKRDREDLVRSLREFELVMRYSPDNAVGYSGAADAHFQLVDLTYGREHDAHMRLGESLANTAIRLDPLSAPAHATLGFHLAFDRRDPAGARREFARAIELDPTYASARHWYGIMSMQTGDFDTAIAQLRVANSLEPTSVPIARWLGFSYYYAHRYDEAVAQLGQALDLDPTNGDALAHLAFTYVQQHRVPAAIAILRHLPSDQFDRAELIVLHAYADALAGRRAQALRAVDALERSRLRATIGGAALAVVYVAVGRNDLAVAVAREKGFMWDESSICPRHDPRLAPIAASMPPLFPQ